MLQEQEDEDFRSFLAAPLPDVHKTMYRYNNTDLEEGQPSKIDSVRWFTGPAFCHTARLPARTRYLGYLTNTTQRGEIASYGQETYVVGIDDATASQTPSNGEMRLVYKASDRNVCPVVPISPDYKDAFMTHQIDGWNKLTFPNPAEREAYVPNERKFLGTLAVVFRGCEWGVCDGGFLRPETIQENKFEMKVNGVPVTALVPIGPQGIDALVLEHADGVNFAPNSDGTYTIQIKVNEAGSFVQISSFMLV
jgi:hypothetical protein